MNYLTKLPKNVRINIAYYLFDYDLLDYLHLDSFMLKLSSDEKLWSLLLLNQYGQEFVDRKPEYLSYKVFYRRLSWKIIRKSLYFNKKYKHGLNIKIIRCTKYRPPEYHDDSDKINQYYCIDVFDDLYNVKLTNNVYIYNKIQSNVIDLICTKIYFMILTYNNVYHIYKFKYDKHICKLNNIKSISICQSKYEPLNYCYIDMNDNLYYKYNDYEPYLIDAGIEQAKILESRIVYIKNKRLYQILINPEKFAKVIGNDYKNYKDLGILDFVPKVLLIDADVKCFTYNNNYMGYDDIEIETPNGSKYLYTFEGTYLKHKRKLPRKNK